MTTPENLFANLPTAAPKELFSTLATGRDVRIERIVSFGQSSPEDFWYDQDQDEWVVILQGAAKLEFEDHTATLQPGDWVHLAAHQKHRVAWTTPDESTIWLAVHYSADKSSA